ncbi:hypothetical protein MTP02_29650 [Streptomyces albus]|nr:hypothetical protein MTP02_29650 [Streptomyces albus]
MLSLIMRRADVDEASAPRFGALIAQLSTSLQPLLGPAVQRQAEILGAQSESLQPFKLPDRYMEAMSVSKAEIFVESGCLYVVTLQSADDSFAFMEETNDEAVIVRLNVSAISSSGDTPQLEKIVETCKEVMGCELREYRFPSQEFDKIREEAGDNFSPPSDDEVKASFVLTEKGNRSLAGRIKKSHGLLVADLNKKGVAEVDFDIESARGALEEAGIVSSEFMVTCGRNGQQIARAPEAELIEKMSQAGVKCVCGKPIARERLEEALTITDMGGGLLDKSRWLSIVVMEELKNLGVKANEILVESTIGGDELDCIANVSGELCLFELKDKEFSLREAYSFGAKMSIVSPRHAVIVTSEYVGGDAKDHFERSRKAGRSARMRRRDPGAPVVYIEGVDAIRSKLNEFVSSIHRSDAGRILIGAMPFAAVLPASLLRVLEGSGSTSSNESVSSSRRRAVRRRQPAKVPPQQGGTAAPGPVPS